jgi:selenocysteine lyase/cysteine desulfurase
VERLLHGLGDIEGVRIYGPPASAPRTPTVAFVVGDQSSDEAAEMLADQAVFVSNGDFYAASVVQRYGLAGRGGLIRAGCAAYTTADEVDRLLDGVARLARRRGS